MKRVSLAMLFAGAASTIAFGQTNQSCAELRQKIAATYDFKPSKLTSAQQDSKSAAMDSFWKSVKADPNRSLPCLRAELQNEQSDKWFRFDTSNLLVEIDPSPESKAIQVRCYTEVDLDDVDLRTWVSVMAARGFEGFDVSEAGARWLAYSSGKYFIPERAYEVNSLEAALFIFGSMEESQATPALARIASQKEHAGREHAVLILLDQATPESLRLATQIDSSGLSAAATSKLNHTIKNPELLSARAKPKNSRSEFVKAFQDILAGDSTAFLDLVSKVPDGERDVIAVLKPDDLPLVRKVRRLFISRGNQHVIEYYKSFTDILMAFVWKPEGAK